VFAILVAGGLMGVFGMIIGVPLLAVIFYMARNALDYIMEKKGLPKDPGSFVEAERLDVEANRLVLRKAQEEPPAKKLQKPEKKGKK